MVLKRTEKSTRSDNPETVEQQSKKTTEKEMKQCGKTEDTKLEIANGRQDKNGTVW